MLITNFYLIGLLVVILINTKNLRRHERKGGKFVAAACSRVRHDKRGIDFNESAANCENRPEPSSRWCSRYSLRRFLNNFRGKVNIFLESCAYLQPPRAPNRVLSRPSSNGLVRREKANEKRKIACNAFI